MINLSQNNILQPKDQDNAYILNNYFITETNDRFFNSNINQDALQ